MEILVAMLLLAGVSAVTFYAFSSSTQIVDNWSNVAYNFGRGHLEEFYERVRQDQWAAVGLPLSTAAPGPQPLVTTLNGVTYTATYAVTSVDLDGDAQEDYRRVTMMVV